MRSVVELVMLVEYKADNKASVDVALRQLADVIRPSLRVYGIQLLGHDKMGPRKATLKDALALGPRRRHFGKNGQALCMPPGKYNFSARRLSEDWKKVDCKKCLAKKPANQGELF